MFKKILKFFQLTDRAGDLSITNIALIVMITKLAVAPTFTIPEIAAFFIALLNYSHKRLESNKAIKNDKLQEDVAAISTALNNLKEQVADNSKLAETIQKQSDEVQKIVNANALQQRFGLKKDK